MYGISPYPQCSASYPPSGGYGGYSAPQESSLVRLGQEAMHPLDTIKKKFHEDIENPFNQTKARLGYDLDSMKTAPGQYSPEELQYIQQSQGRAPSSSTYDVNGTQYHDGAYQAN